ncbi:MAG: LemA family protein [Treponemataceae bacterium]|nr:LemA family protein [Treponemataceae bacterium]
MKNKTKTTLIIIAAVLLVIICVAAYFIKTYNKIVTLEESVDSAWAQVENQYQRRLDLIPNLVATVKGYAKHESSVFTEVADARSKAGGLMQLGSDVLNDPEAFEKFQQAQNQLSGSLSRLIAVAENYPELKANENFLALQDQLEGTENRIATERKRFNDLVKSYNRLVRAFPSNIIAKNHGFEKKAYFAASQEAKTAPKVEF